MIDLTNLFNGSSSEVSLNGTYNIPKNIYEKSEIIELSPINIDGNIENFEGEFDIIANISGRMKINDSISLDEIWYPFTIEIDDKLDEFIEKNEKSLDIIEFLWQNIVLEVPLRYTNVSENTKYLGDGWKLVSEEDLKNNPFSSLLNNEDRSD